jgi:hypothetical protein
MSISSAASRDEFTTFWAMLGSDVIHENFKLQHCKAQAHLSKQHFKRKSLKTGLNTINQDESWLGLTK